MNISASRADLDDVVRDRLEREGPPDLHRLRSTAHAPIVAALLDLGRIEPEHSHQGFVRQQHLPRGEHALDSAHAAHDREQDELDERVQRPCPLFRVQLFQQLPGTDLPEVVEQLVEEGRLVERVDLIHRPRLLQPFRHCRVVACRRLPSGQLRQPRPEILLAGDLARHAARLRTP